MTKSEPNPLSCNEIPHHDVLVDIFSLYGIQLDGPTQQKYCTIFSQYGFEFFFGSIFFKYSKMTY